ncbi:uncharacterized protein VTP21DRAFT_9889 [Calcarisporiella thermophila]|uniref:uncharacterized protein n=1 Tax=Calcarisporiella thermophila TaxID=911321 RepID=UPI0037438E11
MERTFVGAKLDQMADDKNVSVQKPSQETVEKREAERLRNTDEQGRPLEGGSAGRAQAKSAEQARQSC